VAEDERVEQGKYLVDGSQNEGDHDQGPIILEVAIENGHESEMIRLAGSIPLF
jgi:hypothetical protein